MCWLLAGIDETTITLDVDDRYAPVEQMRCNQVVAMATAVVPLCTHHDSELLSGRTQQIGDTALKGGALTNLVIIRALAARHAAQPVAHPAILDACRL